MMITAEYSSIPVDIGAQTITDEGRNPRGVYSWWQTTGEREKARYMMLICYVLAICLIALFILKNDYRCLLRITSCMNDFPLEYYVSPYYHIRAQWVWN